MRKGALNLLGRKNQSLFDPTLEIKEMENTELVLDSSVIPESGTAKVRARPTVKHFPSSSDVLQGFAVPTPKAPLLPPINGLQSPERGFHATSGSLVVPDPVEGKIFIPPPPSMAPPPPPQFISPLPQFTSKLNLSTESLALASLQSPPMPPPKPPSEFHTGKIDLASLKPPSMAPPKPPIKPSSAKGPGLVASFQPNDQIFPEQPKFSPPQPPTLSAEQPQIAYNKNKVPPPKPVRFSSIPSQDDVPPFLAPAPPVNESMPSSFNPQNSAKLYNLPKTTILSGHTNHDIKQKSIIILQDTTVNNAFDQTNGKVPSALTDVPTKSPVPPMKPARRNSSGNQLEKDMEELKYNLQSTLPSQTKLKGLNPSESMKTEDPPLELSPQLKDLPIPSLSLESNTVKYSTGSPARNHKSYSAYSHIPYGHRSSDSSPSPLALLQAAKERERQKYLLYGEKNTKTNSSSEPSSMRISSTEFKPNSFTVNPRSTPSSSLTGLEETDHGPHTTTQDFNSTHNLSARPHYIPQSSELMDERTSFDLIPNNLQPSAFMNSSKEVMQSDVHTTPVVLYSNSFRDEENNEVCAPLIPPPPEFANPETEDESVLIHAERPPSLPPPDPPSHKISQPHSSSAGAAFQKHSPDLMVLDCPSQKITQPSMSASVPTPQSNSPATSPDHLSQKITVPPISSAVPTLQRNGPISSLVPTFQSKGPPPPPKPKPSVMVPKPNMTILSPQTLPKKFTPVSPSQATLLSILQKKMLEMDQKNLLPQVDPTSDDWGSPTDEESGYPCPKRSQPSQSQSLDLGELESQVAKGAQASSASAKSITSKGPQSKALCGKTFTVRPGTKQPITLISKGDSS
ncbi:hypothetical protein GN956_G2200 [Arapaima gigas]